jgi:hypothetical protein
MERDLSHNEKLMEDGHGVCNGDCLDIDGSMCAECEERNKPSLDCIAILKHCLEPLPNPAMKGFQSSRAAKSLYEAYEKEEYNVPVK